MVKETGVPIQVPFVGYTVKVDVMGDEPEFVAANAGRLPVPEVAVNPIAGFEFVHANVVPDKLLEKAVTGKGLLMQAVIFAGTVMCGVGFTVIVYVEDWLQYPLSVGVTVKVAITGIEPVLVAVNEGTFPLPLAGIAMDGLELVQV